MACKSVAVISADIPAPGVSVLSVAAPGPGISVLSVPRPAPSTSVISATVVPPQISVLSVAQPVPATSVLSATVEGKPGRPGAGASPLHEWLTGERDGANTIFTTSAPIKAGTEWVRVCGIPQRSPAHYAVTGPREITFTSPPDTWWALEIEYQEA